ncbi:MAG: hypothetical protein CVV21_04630 [Candidatus Goldiibacteriota bacterium HGW-Goldbacteria-1]|jgi:hypothetical protein|nr:MAG: hypothetical protein CVV21_04630 [Candidatus Goldiibacteriota bacterium HGW-Goldbacteria-1]
MKKQILACVIVLSSSMILFALEKEDKIMVLIENIEKTPAAESAATLVPVPAQQIQQKDIKKTREILDRVLEEKMIDEREALTLQRIKEAENKSAATDLILGVMIMINFLFLVYIMVRLNGREK